MRIFTSHGGRGNEGNMALDGLNVGAAFNGGGVSGYILDTANAAEVQMSLSGGLGEAEKGGIYLNVVPKTGGNTFKGRTLRQRRGIVVAGQQSRRHAAAFGIQNPADDSQQLRHERIARRSDQEGQAVVLRARSATSVQAQDIPGCVRERECRRPECVDVRREPGDH